MSNGPQVTPVSPGESAATPRKRGISMGCILGGLALVLLSGALVCCGGIFGMGYIGIGAFSTMAGNKLRSDPVVVEHLGRIHTCSVNLQATTERSKPGQDVYVFDLEGTKGKGQAAVVNTKTGDKRKVSGTLRTPTGDEVPLALDGP